MDKIKPLLESDICDAIKAHEVYEKAVSKLTDRMNYIIRHCVEVVNGEFQWWDWQNTDAESHAAGDFMESCSGETTQINGEWTNREKMVFLTKDGGEWELAWGEFPTRWLYEDFEEEYANGLKAYAEKQKQRAAKNKEKRLKNAAEQKVVMKKVLAKLTKEERKAIGLK